MTFPSIHILIAEDEGIVGADIHDCLRRAGYRTTLVDNGKAAVEKSALLLPNLVLMDILLKGAIDGIEAAEAIRRRFGIPVVFLSAHTDENTFKRAQAVGPAGYITKPFEEAELHAIIRTALEKAALPRPDSDGLSGLLPRTPPAI